MRRISFWIALVAALGCVWLLNIGALQSQEEMQVSPDQGAPKVIKSLSLTNADIRSVLMYLSAYSGVNIVASPSVTGEVTLRLTNVTWREVLNIILETYTLVGVESANYIRVVKADDYYAEKAAEEKHLMDQANSIPLKTHIISIKYNVASELQNAVKGLLSTRGTVDHDQRTNSLIIKDLPNNIARIDELIGILDKETKQIKISAQLLEVESGWLREIGVDWRLINNYGPDTPVPEDPNNEIDKLFPTNPDRQNYASEEGLIQGTKNLSERLGQFSIARISGDYTINGILSTLASTDKGKIIAHPEVTTLDNVEAYIQMGQKIPIKQFDPSGNTVITFYDVGTKLRVTPHVTSENRILLHLAPERSSYNFDPNGVVINTQHAETNVVVENGETAVIGGLTNQENHNLRLGLPFLKDIPILGFLFGYEKKEVTTRDLVIFVTPTIIESSAQAFNE